MNKAYERIIWKNASAGKTTPLGATNMNKMDAAIDTLDNRVISHDNYLSGIATDIASAIEAAEEAQEAAENAQAVTGISIASATKAGIVKGTDEIAIGTDGSMKVTPLASSVKEVTGSNISVKDAVSGQMALQKWTKNLIPLTLENLKTINTSGTWTDTSSTVSTYLRYGVTWTITHNNDIVTKITANGTATGSDSNMLMTDKKMYDGNSYTFSSVISTNANVGIVLSNFNGDARTDNIVQYGNASITISDATKGSADRYWILISVRRDNTVTDEPFYPMLTEGSEAKPFLPCSYDVTACGKNWNNSELEIGFINYSTGWNQSNDNAVRFKDYVSAIGGMKYAFSVSTALTGNTMARYYDKNKKFLSTEVAIAIGATSNTRVIPSETRFIRLTVTGTTDTSLKYQIELNDATDYEPYQGSTITVTNDSEAPVFGLQSHEGETNVFNSYGAEMTIDYAGNEFGKFSLDKLSMIDGMNESLSSGLEDISELQTDAAVKTLTATTDSGGKITTDGTWYVAFATNSNNNYAITPFINSAGERCFRVTNPVGGVAVANTSVAITYVAY